MKYKGGDFFWLMPAPINPFCVKVKVLAALPQGYFVDEPVGLVNSDVCICNTRTEAELLLKSLYQKGIAQINPEAPNGLESLRKFLLDYCEKRGIRTPTLVDKKRGEEWFSIEDLSNGVAC